MTVPQWTGHKCKDEWHLPQLVCTGTEREVRRGWNGCSKQWSNSIRERVDWAQKGGRSGGSSTYWILIPFPDQHGIVPIKIAVYLLTLQMKDKITVVIAWLIAPCILNYRVSLCIYRYLPELYSISPHILNYRVSAHNSNTMIHWPESSFVVTATHTFGPNAYL